MPRKGMTVRELVVVVVVIAAVAVVVYSLAQRAQQRQPGLDWELYEAAADGGASEVERLLLCSGDVNVRDNDGKTPLQLAEQRGHTDIIALLKQHGAEE